MFVYLRRQNDKIKVWREAKKSIQKNRKHKINIKIKQDHRENCRQSPEKTIYCCVFLIYARILRKKLIIEIKYGEKNKNKKKSSQKRTIEIL